MVGGGGVGADVGDAGVLDGDDEVNAGVGEGLEDFGVGVVDFDLVDEGGLEELRHFFRRGEVVSEGAVVHAHGGDRGGEECGVNEESKSEEKEFGGGNHVGRLWFVMCFGVLLLTTT